MYSIVVYSTKKYKVSAKLEAVCLLQRYHPLDCGFNRKGGERLCVAKHDQCLEPKRKPE